MHAELVVQQEDAHCDEPFQMLRYKPFGSQVEDSVGPDVLLFVQVTGHAMLKFHVSRLFIEMYIRVVGAETARWAEGLMQAEAQAVVRLARLARQAGGRGSALVGLVMKSTVSE